MIRTYYLLTKPGIIMGNLVTTIAGFALASKNAFDLRLLLVTLLGLGLVIASACVFNNFADRGIDQKMARTRRRALVQGLVSGPQALAFATGLGVAGFSLLWLFTNPKATLIAAAGFFIYVLLYAYWKRRSVYGTLVGSFSGATPPVVGYAAAGNQLDSGALLLLLILVVWQMPHFFAIAIYRLKDYTAAGLPLLPVKKGILRTKLSMLFYGVLYVVLVMALHAFGHAGAAYLTVATAMGVIWVVLIARGFRAAEDVAWAKGIFRFSLYVVSVWAVMVCLDSAIG